MLTRKEFDELEKDDLIEGAVLWPFLDKKEVVKLACITRMKDRADFTVMYHNVFVGFWVCEVQDDKLKWSMAQ